MVKYEGGNHRRGLFTKATNDIKIKEMGLKIIIMALI